jgi:Cu-Zn family superoxide dismutase
MRASLAAALCAVGAALAPAAPAAAAEKAYANLIGADGKDVGRIELVETLAGVLITARLKGLPPGPHGFHIMEFGKCEPPFSSAGNILNPLGAKHGLKSDEGPAMGDMPNLYAAASGEVTVELLNPFVTLAPDADGSLIRDSGTAFIIRANADDHKTHPDGNSGARIACGVIKPWER